MLNISTNPTSKPKDFLLDLFIYITIMFLIREIYFSELGFLANGLFWSFSTLTIAIIFMKIRKVSWADIGLKKPESFPKLILATCAIFLSTIISIIIFKIVIEQFPGLISPDTSSESAASKFGELKGNWPLFFSIISMVWLESMLEEVLDRGFLMNWLERLFSKKSFAIALAILFQAFIFGFRHSNDFSERSITVGIIGLIMGIGYYIFGRNLWPLIIAHCILNSMSMIERVL